MSMNSREEELIARALLADPALVNLYWKEQRWAELATVVRYARRDVPVELARLVQSGYALCELPCRGADPRDPARIEGGRVVLPPQDPRRVSTGPG